MADQAFAIGAEVQHKSGGPRMVVVAYDVFEQYEKDKKYKCRWFIKDEIREGTFIEAELKPAASLSGGVPSGPTRKTQWG